jgi:hypothetical protein
MDTAGIRMPTRHIRGFSNFSVSSALRHSPSTRYGIAANDICQFLDIFSKNNVFEDTFLTRENV